MKLYFSIKVSLISFILIMLFCSLSYWQWKRYNWKLGVIAELAARIEINPKEITAKDIESIKDTPDQFFFRRFNFSGKFDFEHEMILRNRRYKGIAGVIVLTPMQINNTKDYIIVNRGFIPLKESEREQRKIFQNNENALFTGFVKESSYRKMFAPKDPDPLETQTWVDDWLRVDLINMQKQLPYKILPVYTETLDTDDIEELKKAILVSKSDKDEILSLANRQVTEAQDLSRYQFPAPLYDLIIPPGRHKQYIFEWAFMALITVCVCFILQLRPPSR